VSLAKDAELIASASSRDHNVGIGETVSLRWPDTAGMCFKT
jgi:hypothetical protein